MEFINDTDNANNIANLSPEQQTAYFKYVQGENIFITGPGGTGKSKLISDLIQQSKSINKKVQVCAMTGCAAILLNCNARTLHSWSGIKLAKGTIDEVVTSVIRNKNISNVWKKTDILILDEVSMLSCKLFEIIEKIGRIVKKSSLPFGGIQVVFTGDFYQLPPIGTHGEPDTNQFCFESNTWNQVFKPENHIELKTIFRQTDPIYINILQQVRNGNLDKHNESILKTRLNPKYNEDEYNGCIPTKLFPLRSKTDYINKMMFDKLNEQEYVYNLTRKSDCIINLDNNKPLPTDVINKCLTLKKQEIDFELDTLSNGIQCPKILRLKKGASVMCTINLDIDNSICNGSQGIVIDINNNGPIVKFANGIIKLIEPHYWQSEEYPMLAVGQYPLCLAWALTIHKMQGATLSIAEIDIGQGIFEYGQTYVALSRVKSLDGLYLSEFNPTKICANPIVSKFYNTMPKSNPVQITHTQIEPDKSDKTDKSDKSDNPDKSDKSDKSDKTDKTIKIINFDKYKYT
jgi:ATP-dependent DNA helicase PIF1